jgi:hypothetical protein
MPPKAMKLYKVHLEYETVIRAESPEAAEQTAAYAMRHEIDDEPSMVFSDEITTLADLPQGWNAGCRPWGERDPNDRTIGQILSANASDRRWRPEDKPLPSRLTAPAVDVDK